jgi:hypothetical protein
VIAEDSGFLAIAVLGFVISRGFEPRRRSALTMTFLSPLAVIVPWIGPRLPGDALVTAFNPGQDLSDLAAEDLTVPLNEGWVLLVLLTDPCAECVEGVSKLNDIAGRAGSPPIAAVFAGTRREARAWALEHVPAFGVASAPVKVLRQYYRRLPQAALLESGIIRKVWRNRIPGWEEVAMVGPEASRATRDTLLAN